ncbi:hypothetical protein ACWDRY_33155, partial [Streptomyces cellulosae]
MAPQHRRVRSRALAVGAAAVAVSAALAAGPAAGAAPMEDAAAPATLARVNALTGVPNFGAPLTYGMICAYS